MTVGRTAFHSFCRRKLLTSLGGAALAAAVAALPALAQEIKPGGTMVVALPGDPDSLNASIVTDISTSNLSGQFYSTIVRQNNDGHVLPDLAKSWEISPDGKTYTFHFHHNVKWHDGTRPGACGTSTRSTTALPRASSKQWNRSRRRTLSLPSSS
jgi:ABC-type transport system substrate-binding protein